MDYQEFLRSKRVVAPVVGFEVADVGHGLFPWQLDIVRWALRLGRAAIFAGCGLGKTAMQLTWADQVARRTGKPVLVLTPLAVAPQTVAEGQKFGIEVTPARQQSDCQPGVNVTNYQKLLGGHFDPKVFAGVVLDESSILKAYMGKTKRLLIEAFANTPYRLACTATPAPNDHMELGNHSQFLGVMDSDEMLTRWFINDLSETGKYRLKGHAEADYWRWVSSWAVCLDRPSDLGYPDDGFILPPLNIREVVVKVDATAGAEGLLFRCDRLTATSLHQEMRLTARARAAAGPRAVNPSPEAWVVWCNTNYEADDLKDLLDPAACEEVRGSETDEAKERKLQRFAEGKTRVLVTKPSIAGFGLNWQHCHNVAFVGLSYSHEQFYQAVRRTWRFGQKKPVNVQVVIAETEGEVLRAIKAKEREHDKMRAAMTEAIRGKTLEERQERRELQQAPAGLKQEKLWGMHLGDCVEVAQRLPADSIDFSIFSPPFSGLYIYSEAECDMGNSASDEEFFRHFGYLVPELYRVMVPGRLCVVHCKDLPKYRGRDGVAGLRDFPGQVIALFESHGWTYHSRVTIWKDPVVEMQRTKTNGLLYKTLRRDASQSRQGMADYLIVFRKPPRETLLSDKPVTHTEGEFPLEQWQRYASPVWMELDRLQALHNKLSRALASGEKISQSQLDLTKGCLDTIRCFMEQWQQPDSLVWYDIDQMDTLNEKVARESKDEKHICPLQLGLIRRCLELWTSPGDLVLSPFAGIGSEGYVALTLGRRFVGIELKRSYWETACKYLAQAEVEARQQTLFDNVA